MIIDLTKVADTDVSFIADHYSNEYNRFGINNPSVKGVGEHYKLLNYLSNLFENKVLLDIGSRTGISALAMAESSNRIISYDIKDVNPDWTKARENAEFENCDILKVSRDILNSASFMSFDIDPHDGIQERQFFDILEEIDYKGLVLCDDIKWDNMLEFWNSITQNKWDISDWGHASGSGLVDFSGEVELIT